MISINLLGNSLATISAKIRPVICATAKAGIKGLSEYLRLSYSENLVANSTSLVDFNKKSTKFFIVSLCQIRAYISESGIVSTRSAHSWSLSVSSDKNPLINK